MTITDEARTNLHQYLKEHMGEEQARTVMALLPPVGWGDLATKQDLAHDFAILRLEMQALRFELKADIAGLRAEFHKTLRTHTLVLVATNITLFGLAVATVRLAV